VLDMVSKCAIIAVGLAGILSISFSPKSLQASENAADICAEQTRIQEKQRGIAKHLLTAISLVESGRWDKQRGENIAWPWTVTSGGEGRFFDSKEEALAEVEILMTQGVRNIDVGCMQINMHYHGDAFDTLSDAFDPKKNTEYAAKFLSRLKSPSNSWIDAAGTYHSSTPEKKAYYQGKVMASWNAQRGRPEVAQKKTNPVKAATWQRPKEIDYSRTNQLNEAFRKRMQSNPVASTTASRVRQKEANRQREIREWQDARAAGRDITHLLAMRRAQLELRKRKKIASMGVSKFPEKRQNQLKKWREKGVWYGG